MKLKLRSLPTQCFPTGKTFKVHSVAAGQALAVTLSNKRIMIQADMVEDICDFIDDSLFCVREELPACAKFTTEPSEQFPSGRNITLTNLPRAKTFGIKISGETAVFNLEQLEYIAHHLDLFVADTE